MLEIRRTSCPFLVSLSLLYLLFIFYLITFSSVDLYREKYCHVRTHIIDISIGMTISVFFIFALFRNYNEAKMK